MVEFIYSPRTYSLNLFKTFFVHLSIAATTHGSRLGPGSASLGAQEQGPRAMSRSCGQHTNLVGVHAQTASLRASSPGRWWRDRWEQSPLPLNTSETPS